MTAACPECAGRRMPRHPAGPLTFDHGLECTLRAREDSRRVADVDLLAGESVPEPADDRPAARDVRAAGLDVAFWEPRDVTETERALLAACGADPDQLGRVIVSVVTTGKGVVRRDFLDDEGRPINVDALAPPEPDPDTSGPLDPTPPTNEGATP